MKDVLTALLFCGELADINGEKGPNQLGRDNFIFFIKENGLFPAGCGNDRADCGLRGSGYGCACKVLREGAMNY